MALFQTQPTIAKPKEWEAWQFLANRETRQAVYNLLTGNPRVQVNQTRYYDFLVAPQNGASFVEAFTILLGYVYGVVAKQQPEWSLPEFWSMSGEAHLQAIRSLITVDDALLTRENVDAAVFEWLVYESTSLLKEIVKDRKIYAEDYKNWWQEGLEAYQRLLYAPANLAIALVDRALHLKNAEALVRELRQMYEDAEIINKGFWQLARHKDQILDNYNRVISRQGVTLNEMYTVWIDTAEDLREIESKSRKLYDPWVNSRAYEKLVEILMITPPAPPVPAK